jgi:hypothetical protein
MKDSNHFVAIKLDLNAIVAQDFFFCSNCVDSIILLDNGNKQ